MKWQTLCLFFLLTSFAAAQTPSDIATEPHHHLLLENKQVRVFALTLRPNEQAYVRHDHSFLMIALRDAELVVWSEGWAPVPSYRFQEGNVRFNMGGRTIGLRNDRTADFQGVIVEFLDPKTSNYGYQSQTGNWDYGGGAIDPPVDPHVKFVNRMTIGTSGAADVQLLPRDVLPPPDKPAAELLIPIADVDLKTGSDIHTRRASGEALWLGEGRKVDLFNASDRPLRFIMVEIRTP